MATITKIKGYCYVFMGWYNFYPESPTVQATKPAVLVISSDATTPVVLTLEEHREKVRAMLMEILLLKKGTLARPVNLVWEQDIKAIAADHGIDLTT